MKSLVSAFVALSIAASPVAAAETIFSSKVGQWNIFGNRADKENNKNAVCIAETTWKDGSTFQLTKDMSDGELYVWFQNLQWNIGDTPKKTYTMKMTVYGSGGKVASGNFKYILLNKNTIVIPGLQGGDFAEMFMTMNKLMFYMPGTIQNAELPLWDSSNAARELVRCIDAHKAAPAKDNKGLPI